MYDILINIIETSILCAFITSVCETEKPKPYIILTGALYIAAGTCMISAFNFWGLDESFYFLADVILGIIYLTVISDRKLPDKLLIVLVPELLLYSLSILFIIAASFILYQKIDFLTLKQNFPVETDLIAQGIYACAFALIAFISRKKRLELSDKQKYLFCMLLLVCQLTVTSISTLILVDRMNDNNIALSALYVFIIIVLLYAIFYDITANNRKLHKAELDRTLLESQIQSTDKLMKTQEELHKLRHDIRQLLPSFNKDSRDPETQDILQRFESMNKDTLIPIETCSIALNTLLNNFREEATEKGADLTLIINLPAAPPLDNEDLCLLVSNLFDNALRHIGIQKKIRAELRSDTYQFSVRIQNSIDQQVLKDDHTFIDHRISGHGYGIQTIEAIVNKYDGSCFFDETCTDFVIMVTIPAVSRQNLTN